MRMGRGETVSKLEWDPPLLCVCSASKNLRWISLASGEEGPHTHGHRSRPQRAKGKGVKGSRWSVAGAANCVLKKSAKR